jgi:hypothetical protein
MEGNLIAKLVFPTAVRRFLNLDAAIDHGKLPQSPPEPCRIQ